MAWFRNRSRSPTSQPPTQRGNEGIAIVVIEGTDTGASLVVSQPEVEIGRGERTVAGDGKLWLRDRSVSNSQARLGLADEGWVLEHNPDATNPTLVNDEPPRRKLVAPGDRIRIGRVVLEVRSKAKQQAAQRARAARENMPTWVLTPDADA